MNIRALALGVVSEWFPSEPIVRVDEASIPGVEGALFPLSRGKGWAIAYRREGRTVGRVNFTIAHELGHYVLHRHLLPGGVNCVAGDILGGISAIEREANSFATALLLPVAEFKRHIHPGEEPSREQLSACADLFAVSITAAMLRWIGFTKRAAMIVLSRDGYVLWARSSQAAMHRKLFLAAARSPIEVPSRSPSAYVKPTEDEWSWVASCWFGVPARELTFRSERYEQVASLVLFADV